MTKLLPTAKKVTLIHDDVEALLPFSPLSLRKLSPTVKKSNAHSQ
jgi:hypothetical protein